MRNNAFGKDWQKRVMEYEPTDVEYNIMTVFDDLAQELRNIDTNTLNVMCRRAGASIKHRLDGRHSEIDKLVGTFHERDECASMEIVENFETMLEKKDDSTAGMIFVYVIKEAATRMDDVGLDSSRICKIAAKSAHMLQ